MNVPDKLVKKRKSKLDKPKKFPTFKSDVFDFLIEIFTWENSKYDTNY